MELLPLDVNDCAWVYEHSSTHQPDVETLCDIGKWMLFISKSSINDKWILAKRLYRENQLFGVLSMKCSTNYKNPRASTNDKGVIILYCNDSNNSDNIIKIGRCILDKFQYDEHQTIYYKTDLQTMNGTSATGEKQNYTYQLVNHLYKGNCIDNIYMSSNDEIVLAVPFCEKDDAKKLGAKWNPSKKYWYCYENTTNKSILLEKWSVNTNMLVLEGEDRAFGGNDLFIDLVPSSCWFSNVRSCIHPKDWDRVRKYIYERVNYCCECCGINTMNDTTNGQLEAHERWNYDDKTKIQRLMRIVALCHQCHQSTHMGLAGILGKHDEAMEHIKRVRNFTDKELFEHNKDAKELWNKRNKSKWELDISLITNAGISIIQIPKKE